MTTQEIPVPAPRETTAPDVPAPAGPQTPGAPTADPPTAAAPATTESAVPGAADAPGPAAPGPAAEVPGPGSATWDRLGQWRYLLVAHRTLVLQAAHPQIGAAVERFSVYNARPWRRFLRTVESLQTYVYGNATERQRELARLERLHRRMRGTDPHGRPFTASDTAARAWVHLTLFEAVVTLHELGGDALDPEEARRFYAEWCALGRLFGLAEGDQPATLEEFRAYFDHMVADVLEDNATVRDLLSGSIFRIPAPSGLPLPDAVWSPLRYVIVSAAVQATQATLPEVYRERLRLTTAPGAGLVVAGVHHAVRTVLSLVPKPWRYMPYASAAIRATGEVTQRPETTPEEFFTSILDQSGDGVVRWPDLLGMARELSTHLDLDEADEGEVHDAFEAWWRQLLAATGTPEDGSVSLAAYRTALAEDRYPGPPGADDGCGRVADVICRLIDRNGDGQVSPTEYARLLDHSPRRHEIVAALRGVDRDGDGTLYTEEFRAALTGFLTGREDLAAARYLLGRA
ncbi:oxygenase MpaB family protein [Actinosynnema sp. NPDC050436]|uniref:oxygenase MpaB family protein n=1 Tax=Actinosynnema sp. NPDC050436 TaxID=3155659 RepID=UPI0033EF995E